MARSTRTRPAAVGALVASLALALLVGAVLARTQPFAKGAPGIPPTPPPPRATIATLAPIANRATPTASIASPPSPPAFQQAPATVARATTSPATARATTSPATARATATAWAEVGRWRETQLIITAPFVVRGPWRICWSAPGSRGTFQLMIGDAAQTNWELRSGPVGATTGAFDVAAGGTFRLMPHAETPYEVVVLDAPPARVDPPPCGPMLGTP